LVFACSVCLTNYNTLNQVLSKVEVDLFSFFVLFDQIEGFLLDQIKQTHSHPHEKMLFLPSSVHTKHISLVLLLQWGASLLLSSTWCGLSILGGSCPGQYNPTPAGIAVPTWWVLSWPIQPYSGRFSSPYFVGSCPGQYNPTPAGLAVPTLLAPVLASTTLLRQV